MIERTEQARAALDGDIGARALEHQRIFHEAKTIDTRDQPTTCYKAEVHDEHDYTDEVWPEPRWINPRTIWLRHCPGVRDESPYPTIVQAIDRGVWIWKQDDIGPEGEFRMCRRLIISRSTDKDGNDEVHVETSVWKTPPREWPPVHIGSNGAGLSLDHDQVQKVWTWLGEWLNPENQEHREPAEPGKAEGDQS